MVTANHWNQDVVANVQAGVPDIFTAAGDMAYATAADVAARLAKGGAYDVLQMNSGATAPEWRTGPSTGFTMGALAGNKHVEAASAVTGAGGNVAVTFSNAFGSNPFVIVSEVSGSGGETCWSDSPSTTGCNLYAYSGATPLNGRWMNWIAEGAD